MQLNVLNYHKFALYKYLSYTITIQKLSVSVSFHSVLWASHQYA